VAVKRFVPDVLKPPLRSVRRAGRTIGAAVGTPLRARAYRSPSSWWLRSLPLPVRRRWRLDPPPLGSRRIEVGSGQTPRPGYIHVDVDPDSRSLDLLVSGNSMPVPSGWSDEVLSVHMIEHVPPPLLRATIREWFRVLKVGGTLQIHTPNGGALGRALVESASGARNHFWAVQSAIFGYGPGPEESDGPERFGDRGDHRIVFTFSVLRPLLEEAGFSQVQDVSGRDPCYHSVAWEPHVPGLCLEVTALKGGTGSENL
jgi:SAM-dependent methyltransferase